MKGIVTILDSDGNVEQEISNRITSDFLNEIAAFWGAWDHDQMSVHAPPLYCAVGSSNVDRDFIHNSKKLGKEARRLPVLSKSIEPITARSRVSTVFRGSDANFDWFELGLFSDVDNVYTLERFESTTSSTWSVIDEDDLRYISHEMTVQDSGAIVMTGDVTAARSLIEITDLGNTITTAGTSGHTVYDIVGFDASEVDLQFFFLIDAPEALQGNLQVDLSYYEDSGFSNGWQWQITPGSLSIGWNHISLNMESGQLGGDLGRRISKFRITAPPAGGVRVWGIDELRLFKSGGKLLARVVLETPIEKVFGETKTISWIIDPLGSVA